MPMTREEHEELLNELLLPDLEQSRRTEILQQLRTDYGSVIADFEDITSTNEKLQKDNSDLVISNSKLFRQIGIHEQGKEKEEETEQKEFSETVTLEDLENSPV